MNSIIIPREQGRVDLVDCQGQEIIFGNHKIYSLVNYILLREDKKPLKYIDNLKRFYKSYIGGNRWNSFADILGEKLKLFLLIVQRNR